MENEKRSLIFDLDGTLIDSSDSIILSLKAAFKDCGVRINERLSKKLVGPPLQSTLERLSGTKDPRTIDLLIKRFKSHYDSIGCFKTKFFNGIPQLLEDLSEARIEMFIVTNKREIPTKKIIKHFSWDKYFIEVLSTDSLGGSIKKKYEVIKYLINKYNLNENIFYVGDTEDDLVASTNAGTDFIYAEWGYGSIDETDITHRASTPNQIHCVINT